MWHFLHPPPQVTIAVFVYLWMRMVRVTPDDDTTISVEDAYIDALVNDEMVSSADEGGLSDDAPDSPIRRSKRILNKTDNDTKKDL